MPTPTRPNPSFMNGVPELLVLRLLSDREMYGYELVAAIAEATGEEIRLGEGVVYPALRGLERAGLLRSRTEKVNGRPRVYYRLSAKGRRRLGDLGDEWARVVNGVAKAMGVKGLGRVSFVR